MRRLRVYIVIERFKPMRNRISHPGITRLCIEAYPLSLVLSSYPSESHFDEGVLVSLVSGCLDLQVTIL